MNETLESFSYIVWYFGDGLDKIDKTDHWGNLGQEGIQRHSKIFSLAFTDRHIYCSAIT